MGKLGPDPASKGHLKSPPENPKFSSSALSTNFFLQRFETYLPSNSAKWDFGAFFLFIRFTPGQKPPLRPYHYSGRTECLPPLPSPSLLDGGSPGPAPLGSLQVALARANSAELEGSVLYASHAGCQAPTPPSLYMVIYGLWQPPCPGVCFTRPPAHASAATFRAQVVLGRA